ncbi:ankyrin repeat protein [Biomphalaria pfeifferi]|uniref:Ankyrin repeat protein n=1 Tax=Biomphalaria pfeifferi TaxID=112525 RepID=A0AAD8FAE7_BIOPF|nr:ankyrin repeat protein [Biomphalaria pfeifferi]
MAVGGKRYNRQHFIASKMKELLEHYEYCVNEVFRSARTDNIIDISNINLSDYRGNTPLILAAKSRDFNAVKRLLEHGASLNCSNGDGSTALCYSYRSIPCLQILVRYGADFSCKRGLNAVKLAVQNDLFDEINSGNKILFEKRGFHFDTALIVASKSPEDKLLLETLIKKCDGLCLKVSLLRTNSIELVKSLISAGVDINESNDRGHTLLHRAVLNNNVQLAQFAVTAKVNIEATDVEGYTAFLLAVTRSIVMMEYLMSCGANTLCANKTGDTALSRALRYGTISAIRLLSKKDLESRDKLNGEDALHNEVSRLLQ